jgi:IS6 family transposase
MRTPEDLDQMMDERGIVIDHSTTYHWVQRYAPEMEKRLRRQWRCLQSAPTCIGLSTNLATRSISISRQPGTAKPQKSFLGKPLNGLEPWETPEIINTDQAPTYAIAIVVQKAEGKCPEETVH